MSSTNHNKKRKINNSKVHKVTDRAGKVTFKHMVEDLNFTMIMMPKMSKIWHRNLTIFLINFKSSLCETNLVKIYE